MRATWISTFAALLSLHEVLGDVAPFYTFPNSNSLDPNNLVTLSQQELRLTLASRLGLSQFHHLGQGVDVYKLQTVGSPQQRLWVDKPDREGAVIVSIGGVSDYKAFFSDSPTFLLENSPAFSSISDLWRTFEAQSENIIETGSKTIYQNSNGGFVDVISPSKNTGIDIEASALDNWNLFENAIGQSEAANFQSGDSTDVTLFEEYMVLHALAARTIDQVIAEKATIFIHLGSLESILRKYGVNSEKYKISARIISSALQNLIQQTAAYPSVLGIFPPVTRVAKRDELIGDFDITKVKRKEAPLNQPSPIIPSSKAEGISPVTPLQTDGSNEGLRVSCFQKEDVCKSETSNCNGHGACVLRNSTDCWLCQCHATNETGSSGTYTQYWGGNACQKKDISVPFLIFVTFGIGTTLTLIWVIGKMMSMGSEELPGELTAGVAVVKKG